MFASSAKATNEENFLLMKLARRVFGTNNIDHCARLCHSSTVTGLAETFGSGAMTNTIDCIETADADLCHRFQYHRAASADRQQNHQGGQQRRKADCCR